MKYYKYKPSSAKRRWSERSMVEMLEQGTHTQAKGLAQNAPERTVPAAFVLQAIAWG